MTQASARGSRKPLRDVTGQFLAYDTAQYDILLKQKESSHEASFRRQASPYTAIECPAVPFIGRQTITNVKRSIVFLKNRKPKRG